MVENSNMERVTNAMIEHWNNMATVFIARRPQEFLDVPAGVSHIDIGEVHLERITSGQDAVTK